MSRSLRRALISLAAVFGGLVVGCAVASAQAPKRVALVIGNSDYRHVNALQGADGEAAALGDALARLGFDVKRRFNADLPAMRSAIDELQRAAADADAALVFFAGHSVRLRGTGRLVPVGATLQDAASVERDTIAIDQVNDALAKARNGFLIVDGCADARLAERLQWAGGTQLGLGELPHRQGLVSAVGAAEERLCSSRALVDSLLVGLEEPDLDAATLFRRLQQLVAFRTGNDQKVALSVGLAAPFFFVRDDQPDSAFRSLGVDPGIETMKRHVGQHAADGLTPLVKSVLSEKESLQARAGARDASRAWNSLIDESWNRARVEKARTSRREAIEARWSREAEAAKQSSGNLQVAALTPPPLPPLPPPMAAPLPSPSAPPARETTDRPGRVTPPKADESAGSRPPASSPPPPSAAGREPKAVTSTPPSASPSLMPTEPKGATPPTPPVPVEPKVVTPVPPPVPPEPKVVTPVPPPEPKVVTPVPPPAPPEPKVATPGPPSATPEPKVTTPVPPPAPPEPKVATPVPPSATPEPKVVTPVPPASPKIVTPVPPPASPEPKVATPAPPPALPEPKLPTPVPPPTVAELKAPALAPSPVLPEPKVPTPVPPPTVAELKAPAPSTPPEPKVATPVPPSASLAEPKATAPPPPAALPTLVPSEPRSASPTSGPASVEPKVVTPVPPSAPQEPPAGKPDSRMTAGGEAPPALAEKPSPSPAAKLDESVPPSTDQKMASLVAPPTAPPAPVFNPESADVLRAAQQELRRVGCYGGAVDGTTGPQTRGALAAAAEKLGAGSGVQPLTERGLQALRDHKGVLCPPAPVAVKAAPPPAAATPTPAYVPPPAATPAPAYVPPPPAVVSNPPPAAPANPAPAPQEKKKIHISM